MLFTERSAAIFHLNMVESNPTIWKLITKSEVFFQDIDVSNNIAHCTLQKQMRPLHTVHKRSNSEAQHSNQMIGVDMTESERQLKVRNNKTTQK